MTESGDGVAVATKRVKQRERIVAVRRRDSSPSGQDGAHRVSRSVNYTRDNNALVFLRAGRWKTARLTSHTVEYFTVVDVVRVVDHA